MKSWKSATQLCHDGETYFDHHGAIVPPIYQNSLFAFKTWEDLEDAFDHKSTSYLYSRLMNPSVRVVEDKIAALCGGERARLMASGMGAISAAILSCVKAEDHIVTIDSVYGPANNFMGDYLKEKANIEVTYIKGTDYSEWESSIRDNTRLFYLESPSSMNFDLQDIRKLTTLARKHSIKTIIDNTWASPVFQKPLLMGVDIEVHSVSKYLGGHSDLVGGVVISSESVINDIVLHENAYLGAKMAPFEAWLVLRSLRTLPLRMKAHQESAIQIVKFLQTHPGIKKINYPGLTDHPQHLLAQKQMNGYSGLLSFVLLTEEIDAVKRFVNGLRIFKIGVSWGGYDSLIYSPNISYIRELSPEKFKAMGVEPGLLRISVGLEDVEDLIKDLEMALQLI